MYSKTLTLSSFLAVFFCFTLGCSSMPPTAAKAENSWQKFDDPSSEHAFSVDIPKGWTAKGGLYRLGYSDWRVMVDLKSPDGKINFRLSDVSIPYYSSPTPSHREGDHVDLGAQAQLTVARYATGQEYAEKYAQSRFKAMCKSLTADPGAAAVSVPDYLPVDRAAKRSTTGEVTYHCDGPAGPMIAFAYARTNDLAGVWAVRTLVSYIAPQEQAAMVQSIMLHCVQSFHPNPEWVKYQGQMDAEGLQYQKQRQAGRMRQLQADVAQAEAKMKAMQGQVASFERGQAQRQAQFQSWDYAFIGITPTVDPMGNPKDVWTGTKSRYWENGLGQTMNSDTPPPGNWHELTPRQP
jgi:hypothetical protein